MQQAELEQLVATIALYPDPVVSQLLMASTYPLEVVEADRWVKAEGAKLKGDALTKALEGKPWDPSVKSLVNFPDVLAMMSKELEWTRKLGDAFIDQQEQVMKAIQSLRAKAKAEGNLKTNEQQKVTTEQSGDSEVIVVEPASASTIYVPTYNPSVVYGAWAYPAYPPYYYPVGAVAAGAISFGLGVAAGAAWGYAWGHANWRHGHMDVDINRNTNINRNIDRNRYSSRTGAQGGRGTWQHDPAHRGGAAYRNQSTAQRFGAASPANAVKSREQFRGKAEQGRRDIAAGRVDRSQVRTGGAASRPVSTGAGPRRQTGAAPTRAGGDAARGGAFQGVERSGGATRAASSRGSTSRASSGGGGRSRSGGMSGGGRRGGGGGGRRR